MHFTICTIGFAGKTAEEFFRLLQQADVKKVIDIRENRTGQLSGFAKYPDILFFLGRVAGISYEHEPTLAPTPEIRRAYRNGRDWTTYESSFRALMAQRGIPERMDPGKFERTTALLCSEPGPEKCHRRLVAEILAQHWRGQGHTVDIRHLQSEMRGAKTRKKKSTHGNDRPGHH